MDGGKTERGQGGVIDEREAEYHELEQLREDEAILEIVISMNLLQMTVLIDCYSYKALF